MNTNSLAPCGVLCDICYGFQREKNRCSGCLTHGNKPYHCTVCSIKRCPEKHGNENLLCVDCAKFPCRRIKSLNKRYVQKYGESIIQNLIKSKEIGIEPFIIQEMEKWKCQKCGQLLCVHKEICLNCGSKNEFFPCQNL